MKLIIFDLDGVLIRAREIHYDALNAALAVHGYTITWAEHLTTYDGLPTRKKLQLLTQLKGLPPSLYASIAAEKQRRTLAMLEERISWNSTLMELFGRLRGDGYTLAVASNAVRETVELALQRVGVLASVHFFLSNEDVEHPKPHPEMYLRCMLAAQVGPSDTLIVEDAPAGRRGAIASGATLCPVLDPDDVTWERLAPYLNRPPKPRKWMAPTMNVLIPMAGAGKRFAQAGYTFPKPLIDVRGKPMIQRVVENLGVDAHFIFIAQQEHERDYNVSTLLRLVAPDCDVVLVDGITEGAACTTLLAKELINTDAALLLANSDQYVRWDPDDFLYSMVADPIIDGGMAVFTATHPKWSFARLGDDGYVAEVAEKRPISDLATVGIYYWRRGADYVRYAEQMIAANKRVNNEFYVCPVFNEAIADGKRIKVHRVAEMWGLGTPEDLREFLDHGPL